MEIENCGKHSQKLNDIMEDLIKQNREIGEQITIHDINEIDMKLFDAYQKILSMAPDGDTITKALNYLGEQVKNGSADITHLNSVAEQSAIIAQREVMDMAVSSEEVINVVANKILLDAALYKAMEENLIGEICSPELEDAHRETYENAEKGDDKSVETLYLTNKAKSFLVNGDKLNAKGKEKGVLILIAQLMDNGSKEAVEWAKKMAEHFEVRDVFDQDGNVDKDAVKSRLEVLAPNINLAAVESRLSKRALEDKERVLELSSSSLRKDISDRIRRRRVTDFRRACNDAINRGEIEEARRIVRENPELAKEAQEAIEQEQKRLEREKARIADLLKDRGEER